MTFDPAALLALDIPETVQTYGPREAALYALGVGVGMDPLDQSQLALLDDSRPIALPTMAVVLGFTNFWVQQQPTGIDATRVLHAAQGLRLHAPLPPAGTIRRKTRVTGIIDKGADKGALVQTTDTLTDQHGMVLATLSSTILCRGEGGMGGTQNTAPAPHPVPDRAADASIVLPASPQQALIYRLSGDLNPLHSDPAFARAAGFPGPILHGLATYGMAGQALLRTLCAGEPTRFHALDVRFTRPVFPGEALALDYWIEAPGLASVRVRAPDRGVIALDNGRFEYSD